MHPVINLHSLLIKLGSQNPNLSVDLAVLVGEVHPVVLV
jgi:hypothetical protein